MNRKIDYLRTIKSKFGDGWFSVKLMHEASDFDCEKEACKKMLQRMEQQGFLERTEQRQKHMSTDRKSYGMIHSKRLYRITYKGKIYIKKRKIDNKDS